MPDFTVIGAALSPNEGGAWDEVLRGAERFIRHMPDCASAEQAEDLARHEVESQGGLLFVTGVVHGHAEQADRAVFVDPTIVCESS